MPTPRETLLAGLDCVHAATALSQRVRRAHPTAGLKEAADFQWSWRMRRGTDQFPQLFWHDGDGDPEAAMIATEWADGISLDLIVLPDASPDWISHVVDRGLRHVDQLGPEALEIEVDRVDATLCGLFVEHGFAVEQDGVIEAWISSTARPGVAVLADGYRLTSRSETAGRPHHMISVERNHADPEPRLRQTSLYRADLDLLVLDERDQVAAYGLFWHDPVTATGLVEPMRTEDDHQGRGLARHLLTAGLDLLAGAGVERTKIVYEPDNAAAEHVYLGVGFVPDRHTDLLVRRPS